MDFVVDIIFKIVACIVAAIILLWYFMKLMYPTILQKWLNKSEEKDAKCNVCKGTVKDREEYLFLIPNYFDKPHVKELQYYLDNGVYISDLNQIPAGRRACKMVVMQCQNCGRREVAVIDFLQVREMAVLKGVEVHPYDQVKELLETLPAPMDVNNGNTCENVNYTSVSNGTDSEMETKFGITRKSVLPR